MLRATGGPPMRPGSAQGLQLVVGELHPCREGEELDNVGFFFFSDPDGNGWAVQQISSRLA
ncbi:hypothetical protein [Amycolatopsis magusensis]|uniref:hypothetical protein n=1 Tax=Amycolatopsis magusensis TaxID=882444 RepID=UPI0037ACC73E